jgi:hypothetical protein
MRSQAQTFLSVGRISRQLDLCLQSLAKYLPAGSALFVLDYGESETGVRDCCDPFRDTLDLKYARAPKGTSPPAFLNWALAEFWAVGNDLLLLHAQTEVTPGFLEEMHPGAE